MMTTEDMTALSGSEQWTVVGLKDERTGDLSYEFIFPVGDGTAGTQEIGGELSYRQMAQRLARRTTMLPKAGATGLIENLVSGAAGRFVIKARQPGWKKNVVADLKRPHPDFAAFVIPGRVIGPARAAYRWPVPMGNGPNIGQSAGDLQGWSTSIASLARASNYLAFAVMLALAGPLLAFTDLPEDPAFNWFGETSVGKTTAAKVGASVFGHPDAIRNWDISERGLEEAAAGHTDLMLVLNAAERAAPKRRRDLLNRITHMVAERTSTARSDAVQDQLPNLTWRAGLLCTSNRSGAQMATEAGLSWDLQESVRLIDIWIPPAKEGGIFDRLGSTADKAAHSTELIRTLEKALQQNYGVLVEPWIEHLLSIDQRERVAELMARFDRKTGPHSGLEDRVARKFAVVYAAGKRAVEAGLLPWPRGLPLSATKTLLARARDAREGKDQCTGKALSALVHALEDETRVRPAVPGKPVKINDERHFLGIRYRQGGRELIGLRKEGLSMLVGPGMLNPVLERLRRFGALRIGHGGKLTRQLPFVLKVGSKTYAKPRFLVIEPSRLAALIGHEG